jgi:hypothetical protein
VDQVSPGLLGSLTAEAGWGLAVAQLLACLLLATAIRGGRAAADLVAATVQLVWSVVDLACARLVALLALALRSPVLGALTPTTPRSTPARVLDSGRVLARRTTRRGPPAAAFSQPVPSRAALAPLAFPATG